MEKILWILLILLVLQRFGELLLANSNRRWMMERGARESGADHYYLFILLHTLFFISLLTEFTFATVRVNWLFQLAMGMFVLLQVLRIWCIYSLGRRWNTRILVLPDEKPLKRGPYRFISHPNYVIVFWELLFIPILFGAYLTALVFPFFHLLVLMVRIPAEERALEERV